MNWIDKLQRRFGHVCIHNLMMVIILGQAMVYVADLLSPLVGIASNLSLVWSAVLRGQVWRLVTFVFVPSATGPLALVLTLYFYYLIGHALEQAWGDFWFNVYYLTGMVGAILAAAVTGVGTTYYLNLSLFFAFAMLYPDFGVLLFFIIPLKMKYLALFSAALCALDFLFGSWSTKACILLALGNFLLFFGRDFWHTAKREYGYWKNRRAWQNGNRRW